jgi:tRNA pseudouridine32 synthase / 23S rRNA pseudouridine746 synthase
MVLEKDPYFIELGPGAEGFPLPERFTYPFAYEPHPLCRIAVEQLQAYLREQKDFKHNFGLAENSEQKGLPIGKMFGVVVVRNQKGVLGYLAACSGKLGGRNQHKRLVPPVFDLLKEEGFFLKEEQVLNAMNAEIDLWECHPAWQGYNFEKAAMLTRFSEELEQLKSAAKEGKKRRKELRTKAGNFWDPETLANESIAEQYALKAMKRRQTALLAHIHGKIEPIRQKIEALKERRRIKSAQLQKHIFEQYTFLNGLGEERSLYDIFKNTQVLWPPAGAGECAAPKLLQYSFLRGYQPLCMAEFWWGQSPVSEVRLHGRYYPACQSKCAPILGHMLTGLAVDPNPMEQNPAEGKELEIVFEDEFLWVVDKPSEFLSVPGKIVKDSVYTRFLSAYPQATGPLIVHRLDMSTSGLMVLAKEKWVHEQLQRQFIKRQVRKRYLALLEGIIQGEEGTIDLPLRVDLDDRPRQLVCFEHGKSARTLWKVLERKEGKTLVHFEPVTGRTHQLRVHAAHPLGLGTPIVGDDLYGTPAQRLCLHAELLELVHPKTKERMVFHRPTDFDTLV